MDACDVAVVGAGAAGLMCAIQAGRKVSGRRIVLLDSAERIGAKVLVSGGGRCNVTHERVEASDFAGSSRKAIEKVLRRFGVEETVAFFHELGVGLKREETGKLFPTTDRARTVLDALLRAAREAGVDARNPRRVTDVERTEGGYRVAGEWGELVARTLVIATGGKSYPKTGSDGFGYELVRGLGHSITPRVFPGLVPLTLPEGHVLRSLSGLSAGVHLDVRAGTGARRASASGSLLCTHFGVSGPAVLDVSRHFLDARLDDPGTRLFVSWLPSTRPEELDAELTAMGGATPLSILRTRLPERLLRALSREAVVDETTPGYRLSREARRALVRVLTGMELPISGDRGFDQAEVTAGGVPLSELVLATLESRVSPGLHLCGEICDVDGRLGGFNFQWAWASGYVAGVSAGVISRPASLS
jgi:predicted Rossmann fold flavoprotein